MDHNLSPIIISNSCTLLSNSSVWLEIRLFYVRISPLVIDVVPQQLTLRHIHRELGVSPEINGSHISSSNSAHLTFYRDRLNRETSEVTYLSTDNIRVTSGFEFEVCEDEKKLSCGSLERMEGEWSMDCYMAISAMEPGNSAFI
ncbi:hypothetical protein V6N13_004954 [Hibiscus sabdariffa]|uniref:Uncharacterized protein n=1 Tax=Hibiscus sabdariffa TaxID=183260 RepID=A0ABR2RZZ3_9ROSI